MLAERLMDLICNALIQLNQHLVIMKGKFNNAFVVCGPESSGSVFIAQVLSYAIGVCKYYKEYSGYGCNMDIWGEGLVLHRSIPYQRPKRWQDSLLKEVEGFKEKYQHVNYILTTRYSEVSIRSKMNRFGDDLLSARADLVQALPFFQLLASDASTFIWSYETMLLLKDAYFLRLYNHFKIDSDFIPDIYDGNAPYLVNL
jgi:hypothetical protein